jgi:hypothetical protein
MNPRMRPSGKRFAIRGFTHNRPRFVRRQVAAEYGGLNAINAPEIRELWHGWLAWSHEQRNRLLHRPPSAAVRVTLPLEERRQTAEVMREPVECRCSTTRRSRSASRPIRGERNRQRVTAPTPRHPDDQGIAYQHRAGSAKNEPCRRHLMRQRAARVPRRNGRSGRAANGR